MAGYAKAKIALISKVVLAANDYTTQAPVGSGMGNAITILYGAGGVSDDGYIQVHPTGEIEILRGGNQYSVQIQLHIARTNVAGNAILHAWFEMKPAGGSWMQVPNTQTRSLTLPDLEIETEEIGISFIDDDIPAGTLLRTRFARNEAGKDQGFLVPYILAGSFAGLTDTPSAELELRRLT